MRLFDERRRAILMSNNFRGYARTASGNPVALADCMNDYPVSVSVSGNTVQEGTPTPETPIEMYSCGDRTANLFDAGDKYKYNIPYTVDDNGWISVTFNNTNGSVKTAQPIMTNPSKEILPNTQYLFVIEIEELTTNAYLNPVSKETDYGRVGQFLESYNMETTGIFVKTITSREDLSIAETMLRGQIMVEAGQIGKAVYRISVLPYDETITADNFVYEPFGYKVPVKVSGKNLFDAYNRYWGGSPSEDDWIVIEKDNSEGTSTYYSTPFVHASDLIQASTNYTLVVEVKEISGCTINATNSYTAAQPGQFENSSVLVTTVGTHIHTITSRDDLSECVVMLRNQVATPAGSIGKAVYRISVLPYDESLTPETFVYEPYHEPQSFNIYTKEPINGNTSVADVIAVDVDSKTCTDMRNYAEIVFDGSSTVADMSRYAGIKETVTNFRLYDATDGKYYGNVISSYFINKDGWNRDIECVFITSAGNIDVGISYAVLGITPEATVEERVSAFKAWLTAQAEAGTPLTVIYQLAEPTTTDISAMQNWNSIPKLNRGTNIITAETETEPSAIEVNYYADKTGV